MAVILWNSFLKIDTIEENDKNVSLAIILEEIVPQNVSF